MGNANVRQASGQWKGLLDEDNRYGCTEPMHRFGQGNAEHLGATYSSVP
jgi:hypothetical protein